MMCSNNAPRPIRATAALLALALAGCSDLTTGPGTVPDGPAPQYIINGVDDFDREAVAAIMVYDPAFPEKPGWRSFCTGALIHKRVIMTAGHCIHGIRAGLAAGVMHAAWISFQHDPLEHFDADPAVGDPAAGGWHAIESFHHNPANPDFSDFPALFPIWGDFHDSGAIVLESDVKGTQPMKIPSRPGMVDGLLAKAGCRSGTADCPLVAVGYGLMAFPVPPPPLQTRQSAFLRYKGIDPLYIATFEDPPGSEFGAVCFGDSGGPIILLKDNGRDRTIVAISGSPEDPLAFPCTDAAIQYRVDTEEHLEFIRGVLRSVDRSRG